MLDITTVADLQPLVGSPAFVPAVHSYVRNSSHGNLPLDPVIFQAILLCMVAGDKHLIFHTPEEDVGLVVKLSVWTLSSLFDLPTHKVKIRPRPSLTTRSSEILPPRDPNLFIRSLFLQSNSHDSLDQSRPSFHSRTRSAKRRSGYLRSRSFPNDLSFLGKPSSGTHTDLIVDKELQKSIHEAVKLPLPIVAPQPRPFTHARTAQPVFPHALVLSGLEHANGAEQASLAGILSHRQVVLETIKHEGTYIGPSDDLDYEGTWNVPEGFISIYVCPWDARERPKIHNRLLDQFTMSSTVFVQQHIRQALRALPFASNPMSHLRFHSHSHSNPPTPSPLQSPSLPPPRTPPMSSHPLPLLPREFIQFLQTTAQRAHISSTLSLYLSDLFSAVRHHPKLDGTFLTARSMNDAKALARAGRVLGSDPTGGELIRDHHGMMTFEEGEDGEGEYRSLHVHNDIASGSGSVTINVLQEVAPSQGSHAASVNDHDYTSTGAVDDLLDALYVSEADIARIVPRVVTHRLRVRDGPEDEILAGAIFGATFEPQVKRSTGSSANDYDWDSRSTVKDILVEILAEV